MISIHYWQRFKRVFLQLALLASIVTLSACGGGSSETVTQPEEQALNPCVTFSGDESQNSECGTLLVGGTDADGDFLTYSVDIVDLTLTRRDGLVVDVLPNASRIDFAQYVDMTELVSAATIPNGVYVAGEITLDYTNADIQIEKDGIAVPAQMVDTDGNPLTQVTLQIEIDNRNAVVIAPGRPALMELDFNLQASHDVDLTADPITVTTQGFISAEIDPVLEKEFRIRGPLLRVNQDEGFYRIAVRPFWKRDGHHGGVNIFVSDDTRWMIDEVAYSGMDGLAALAEKPEATATVAFGVFNRESRRFTAAVVYAGSSVPGGELDGIMGHVLARNGNTLTIRGATLIRSDARVDFNDVMTVTVADTTRVSKPRAGDAALSIDDISVGQRIALLGSWDDAREVFDATNGYARLLLTAVSGFTNSMTDSELNLDAKAFGHNRVDLFDFTGTGQTAGDDADPSNYQVALNNLSPMLDAGDPVRVLGWVRPYGQAPADFDAHSIADFSVSAAKMSVIWAEQGSSDAFAQLDTSGILLNLTPEVLGHLHHLIQGGMRTDLLSLDTQPLIVATDLERGVFAIADHGVVSMHSGFDAFINDLAGRMEDGALVKAVDMKGQMQRDANQFKAIYIAVLIN